jgi:hypothetical protein
MPHVNESERMYIEMGKNKDEREREAKGHFAIFHDKQVQRSYFLWSNDGRAEPEQRRQ